MRSTAVYVRHAAAPLLAFAMVVAVAIVPSTRHSTLVRTVAAHGRVAGVVAVLASFLAIGALVLWRTRLSRSGLRLARGRGGHLILHLWPVITLTPAYPLASERMLGHEVGGVGLTTFLLAVALTLPWLLQGVCMPLYRSIGELAHAGDVEALRRGFCAAVPGATVQAIPFVLVSGVPLVVVLHWSPTAVGAFWGLLLINVLFAQSLVLANVTRSRPNWVLGWSAYAVAVLVAPTWWWLPPVAGLLTQLVPMRRQLLTRPVPMTPRDVLGDILRGLVLGSVMWGDKLFYFYHAGGELPVVILFIASLPAIVAYNFYFICRSPDFDNAVKRLHQALQSEPLRTLGRYTDAVYQASLRCVRDTALVGAALVGGTVVLLWAIAPAQAALIGAVSATSWLCAVISIACYKLEYVNDLLATLAVGALHLGVCAVLFAGPLSASGIYVGIVCGDAVALVAAVLLLSRAWRAPEHTLFWRRALAW